MKFLTKTYIYIYEFLFIILFFILETLTRNELLLTFVVLVFAFLIVLTPYQRKTKFALWVIGTIIGFLVEVVMGLVTRSQFWSYGSLLGVPLWLPFIWGLGFEVIYILGLTLQKWMGKE